MIGLIVSIAIAPDKDKSFESKRLSFTSSHK